MTESRYLGKYFSRLPAEMGCFIQLLTLGMPSIMAEVRLVQEPLPN